LCDYWRTATFDALDLTSSQVFGWFIMNHSSSEVSQLHFPGDRSTLVQWGRDTAANNGVNLAAFQSVLVVQNFGVDHGAAGNGVLIVHQDPNVCEFGFIAHEMGHAFGLPHSNSANPDMVYGDGWDLMSFATTTFQFPIQFRGTRGDATVGVNARNLEALNAVPVRRTWAPAAADFSAQIVLDPLNQTPIGNHGFLVAKITAEVNATTEGEREFIHNRISSQSGMGSEYPRGCGSDSRNPFQYFVIPPTNHLGPIHQPGRSS
jgi:hypothetical protein